MQLDESLRAIVAADRFQIPDPPSLFTAAVPPELDALVLRCLEKNPDARPTTNDLETALSDDLK